MSYIVRNFVALRICHLSNMSGGRWAALEIASSKLGGPPLQATRRPRAPPDLLVPGGFWNLLTHQRAKLVQSVMKAPG
jgi:hypothetical protein